jgi:plasmid stability protein
MPSLTLYIPKCLHQQLTALAARHRRSLSQEALACLKQIVLTEPVNALAVLRRAKAHRVHVKPIRQRDLDAWLRQPNHRDR